MRRALIFLCLCAAAAAQSTAPQGVVVEVDIAPGDWKDSGLDLRAGDTVMISADGSLTFTQGKQTKKLTPAGATRGFRDLLKAYPVNEGGAGALIGRIGSSETTQPFLVGERKEIKVLRAGRLFLSLNLTDRDSAEGSYHAKIEITARGAETPQSIPDYKLPRVTSEMVERIPRRVSDLQGNPGDNTNFLIIGDEKDVIATFMAAGWVKVDRAKADAVVHGLLSVLTKQAYVELPMSELTLFGRVQDYGLAHAEPIAVVAQRHHLRLWKAPFEAQGREVWVGAATHDTGFDRDQRNGNLTHKIDPEIDTEREYVAHSLDDTGLVAKLGYMVPREAIKEARTAHGEAYRSDGRILVVILASAAR